MNNVNRRISALHYVTGYVFDALGYHFHKGAEERISPVLMTALTTGLGMLPLALAHGSGAEAAG